MKKNTLKLLIPTLTLTFLLTACAKAQEVPDEPVLTPSESPVETPVEEETPVETPVEEPEEIKEEIAEPVKTTEKVTEEVKIPFSTVKKNDETLEKGKTVVTQKGVDGIETVTFEVEMTDGKETGRKEVGRVVTKKVVEEVVKVGVKVTENATASTSKPVPTPTPKPSSKPAPVVKVKEELKTEVIAFSTEEKKDEILLVGETEVEREGVNGERILKYRVTLTDGKETGRELISNTVTKEPVSKIVKVGTRVYVSHDENMAKYLPAGYSFGEGGWPFALSGSGIYKGEKLVAGISLEVINMDVNLSHEEQLKLAEFFVIYRWQETVREDVINALKQYHEHGGFGKSGLVSCTWGEFVVQIYYSNAG